jgi:hypothetical protein
MNSPLHRDNILNPNYSEIGISLKSGNYEGVGTDYIVQYFGKPKTVASLTESELTNTNEVKEVVALTPDSNEESNMRRFEIPTNRKVLKDEIVREGSVKSATSTTSNTDGNLIIKEISGVKEIDANPKEVVKEIVSKPVDLNFMQKLPFKAEMLSKVLLGFISLVVFSSTILLFANEWKQHHIHHLRYGLILSLMLMFLLKM